MMTRNEHGETGHLNVYIRDQESSVTSYGTHYRVIACLPDAKGLYCRVDNKNGPRAPTIAEILTVARLDQGVRGRWILANTAEHSDGKSTDYHFKRA
jgi:hypothetical protein